jgi:hypothetical protein
MPTAEGRVLSPQAVQASGFSARTDFVYEYHYKDHLGNLRVAFREGNQFTYRATMPACRTGRETQNVTVEQEQWERVNESRNNELYCTGAYAAKLTKANPLCLADAQSRQRR